MSSSFAAAMALAASVSAQKMGAQEVVSNIEDHESVRRHEQHCANHLGHQHV